MIGARTHQDPYQDEARATGAFDDRSHGYGRGVPPPRDVSIADLLRQFRDDLTLLFRQEFQLASAEMSDKAKRAGVSAGKIAVGGVLVLLAGVWFLLTATILLMGLMVALEVSPMVYAWLAPLLVGFVVGLIGWGLYASGKQSLRNQTAVPQRTAESMRENKEWVEEKVTS